MVEVHGCGRPPVAVSSRLLDEPVRPNGTHSRTRGLFADAVDEGHPPLPVEDEGRLNDAVLPFAGRIFAQARPRELLCPAPPPTYENNPFAPTSGRARPVQPRQVTRPATQPVSS
ncbi:hypothetical protein ACFFV7_27745 [Nonomuraea spiralis]|uniref:Uncharacterized protein n=1 Tax=Nonomuraea spiralis TaxID=46182 RepID=A0ABV5IKF9_9ACTN|nr:hypothetical protein [Nonomuraea spiralis]GGT19932.1 hypothetical protein GCM10010176_075590 [Nonomuraea spiralis]